MMNEPIRQEEEGDGIDLDAMSRVVAVYGSLAMIRLMKLTIFIQGLRGIGIETA